MYDLPGVIIKLLITSMDETGELLQRYTPPIKILQTSTSISCDRSFTFN